MCIMILFQIICNIYKPHALYTTNVCEIRHRNVTTRNAIFANSFDDVSAPARGLPLEKNTMRGTCARRRVVMYRGASVVATVVRTPRSEVSERHRAGSWVWVVAKSRLDIW